MFASDGENVTIQAVNSSNPTSDNFTHKIYSGENLSEFNIYTNVEDMKMLPRDYKVELANGVIHFEADNIEYWIAGKSK